ncbi:INO80 complex subunit C-like [Sinocyclocheilus grahami]|uniref:INO80 complex subunit C-like n=1 Tax=Sinocyclocheilus grahami TaxID=75366 RepID=A0A672R3B8_SINGR|nr:PREDICTED: INO80 complex subunit C-like [Sinocyclocheilus grahami]
MSASSEPGVSKARDLNPATLSAGKAQTAAALVAQARSKKRTASPATHTSPQPNNNSSSSSSSSSSKKKTQPASSTTQAPHLSQVAPVESTFEGKPVGVVDVETSAKCLPFKDPNFVHSGIGGAAAGKKNRTWKNLKQILAAEKTLPWKITDPNYCSLDTPPSMKPVKKYSDISGLPANYTDPQTKLHFASTEEFSYIRQLPTDVVTGYLALRKATCIVP